jgi:hypothetical protein
MGLLDSMGRLLLYWDYGTHGTYSYRTRGREGYFVGGYETVAWWDYTSVKAKEIVSFQDDNDLNEAAPFSLGCDDPNKQCLVEAILQDLRESASFTELLVLWAHPSLRYLLTPCWLTLQSLY